MNKFQDQLDQYAELIVKKGIHTQKGEPLVITSPVEGAYFARLLAKHAYALGASEVHVNWNDEVLTRLKYENAPMEVFENYPLWFADGLEDYAKKGAGFISISAQDPELLKGIDSKKIAAANKAASLALKGWRKYTMNDINSWCVVSIPTQNWAKRVFPEMADEQAMEALWKAIFMANRMDQADPVKAWDQHLETLKEKMSYLNEKAFKSLHFTAQNGTDLMVELPEGHIWAGGGSQNARGTDFVANMPTEEVFTMPRRDGVHGVVYSSKPLNYGGSLIDEFKLTFKDGKVVDYSAKKGEEVLKELLDIDEGAKHLGEVALVPYSSPISQLDTIFFNTLFDENASCHFAFGKAYPTNIKNGENMTDEELEQHGVNNSLTHVDFMVGTRDLSIVGETAQGEKIQIFKEGEWAI